MANAKILPFPKSAANTTTKNVDDNTKNTTSIGKYVSSSSKVTNESIENFLKSQQQNIDHDNNNLKRKLSDR